jgi:hypothetical protein
MFAFLPLPMQRNESLHVANKLASFPLIQARGEGPYPCGWGLCSLQIIQAVAYRPRGICLDDFFSLGPTPFEPFPRAALQTDRGQTMCGPLFLTVASFGLLSVGACLGFVTAALFAAGGAEPADLPKPKIVVSIPDDSAEVVWQAAASLYLLGECLHEGENPFGAMADAARALHRVADRFPPVCPGPSDARRYEVNCDQL